MRPAGSKRRKVSPLYDGGGGVSYGRQSGITAIRIAKPFIHPFDMVANLEEAAQGRRMKRSRFDTIKLSQFDAYREQSMREAAARRAGEHYLTCVST
jgi:hypothetical protein